MPVSANLFYFVSLDLGRLSLPECISPRPWAIAENMKVQTCKLSLKKCLKTPIIVFPFTLIGFLELYMQDLLLSDITEQENLYFMIDYIRATLDHLSLKTHSIVCFFSSLQVSCAAVLWITLNLSVFRFWQLD